MCTGTLETLKQLELLDNEFVSALIQLNVKSTNFNKNNLQPLKSFNELLSHGAFPEKTGLQLSGNAIWHFYSAEKGIDIYYSAVIVQDWGEQYFNFDVNNAEYVNQI